MSGLPGVDLDALARWLDGAAPGLRDGALEGELLTGGKSNLTYRLTDGTTTWALRRPPLGHALPTAHDMAREFRLLTALHGTEVPVARPVVLCEDPDVLGAPFYLMSFVDGVVLDDPTVLATLSPAQARHACDLLVDTLLAVHRIDTAAVGLGGFGRPDGFLGRQVTRWTAQWDASETQPRPGLRELVTRLAETVPEQSAPGLVHGDYRLTNVIFTPDVSGIAAVVDWEMTTVGDPLADVGLLVVYQDLALQGGFVMPAATVAAGFATSQEMVQRYAAGSDRDLSALDWYTSFAYYKLAVIAEGIHYRYLQGKTVGPGFDDIGRWVPTLLESATLHLARYAA